MAEKNQMQPKEDCNIQSSNGYSNNAYEETNFSNMNKETLPNDHKDSTGCVELGRNKGQGNIYQTRYRINHSEQRSGLCHDVLLEEMSPCCGEKAKRSCGYMTWAIIRSEAFLFTLHMTALALGVIKEAANFREENENSHIIHSVVETFVSMLLISVRVASGWTAFYHIKKTAKRHEILPEKDDYYKKHHIQGKSLKRHLIAFTCLGLFLELFLIFTFLIFKYMANLGWTILTNQFALVIIGMTSGLFMARVGIAESIIREDHIKTVLFEAVLLVRELHHIFTDKGVHNEDQKHIISHAEMFCKALEDTEIFDQPEHIKFHHGNRPAQNVTLNAMKQTYI